MTAQAVLVDPTTGMQLAIALAPGGASTLGHIGTQSNATTSLGAVTVLAPTPNVEGDVFAVLDVDGNAATNNITVSGNGKLIDGATTLVLNYDDAYAVFLYDRGEWRRMAPRRLDPVTQTIVELLGDTNEAAPATPAPASSVIYRPGVASASPYVETWAEVQALIALAVAPEFIVYVDDSANLGGATIPAVTTDCRGLVTLKKLPSVKDYTTLGIDVGGVLLDLVALDGISLNLNSGSGMPSLDFTWTTGLAHLSLVNGAQLIQQGAFSGLLIPDGNVFYLICTTQFGPAATDGALTAPGGGSIVNMMGASAVILFLRGVWEVPDGAFSDSGGGTASLSISYDANLNASLTPIFPAFSGMSGTVDWTSQGFPASLLKPAVTAAYTAHFGEVVLVDSSGGNIDVAAPPGIQPGATFTVKCSALSANVVNVTTAGGRTIDGAASPDILAPVAVLVCRTYVQDGAGDWFILTGL